jgi:hypothetical protein
MAITRTPMVDDDGTGTTGTIINNAWKQEFYNQIDAATDTEFLSLGTGPFDNYPLAATKRIHYLNMTVTATLTGCANGKPGDILIVSNATGDPTRPITLPHQSAASAAANRFTNFATSGPTMLAGTAAVVGGAATYVYDSFFNMWRLVVHEQGGWITAPFSAANFTTNTGTWTVEAADVVACRYRMSGRTLTIAIYINASSTAGGPNNLQIGNGAWGGYTINGGNVPGTRATVCSETGPGGTFVDAQLNSSTNFVYFVKTTAAAWAAATNLVLVAGQIMVEVN